MRQIHDSANFPLGADQVEVDACLSAADCVADNYTLGTPGPALAPPAGVSPGSVAGLQFTFTSSSSGFVLDPGHFEDAGGDARLAARLGAVVDTPRPPTTGHVVLAHRPGPLAPRPSGSSN